MIGHRNASASEMDGPSIEWKMEEANEYDGMPYYRQDNCGLSIVISDECSELAEVEAKVGEAVFTLDDFKMADAHSYVFELSAKELSDLIRSDGEVTAYVYVLDMDGNADEDALTFILDRVLPEYTLTLDDPSGDETVDGEIAYYGSSHDQLCAVYTITEENFDPMLIGADYICTKTEGEDMQTGDMKKQISGGAGFANGQTYVVGTKDGAEGVYRFGISGTDRAGNPLVMSEKETQKESYQKSILSEENVYWTAPKVLDLTKPYLSFSVSGPDGKCFYEGETAGDSVTVSNYAPFQRSEWAKVSICATDALQCRIDYQIQSSSEGMICNEKEKDQLLEDPVVTEILTGDQKFWIGRVRVKDRAGNMTEMGRSNVLYLDRESPRAKISAPEPVVLATDQITHRNADGRGLYNDDVTLQVTVRDGDGSDAGCGLQNVSCKVFVDGREEDSEGAYAKRLRECLNDAPDASIPEQVSYGDDSALSGCEAAYTGTIIIPKGDVFETNDIEVRVYAQDNAGNHTEGDEIGRIKLGIDSVGPKVRVSFDNNAAQNKMYFKDPRTARIRIYDRNIDPDRILSDTQTEDMTGITYEGTDCYLKEIRYRKDGDYTLVVGGTDALGNGLEREVSFEGTAPDHFVIDQTVPELLIENLQEGNAYNGEIAPLVKISDENFSGDLASLSLSGAREGGRNDLLPAMQADKKGGSFQMQNIPAVRENDDIYTMEAHAKDLAGNEADQTIEFSVNRFGSTYDFNNDHSTQDLVRTYYSNRETDLCLREININRLTDQKVTLYHDGANRTLQRGTDYRLKQESYGDSMQYIYEFFDFNFKKEGIYEVIVQSQDAAGNINSNRSMRQDEGIEPVSIRFAIDKTAPQILFNGTDATKEPAFSQGERITILPEDNMRLKEVQVALERDKKETVLESYTGKMLSQKLAQADGALAFTFDAEKKEERLKVRAVDAAGNVSVGLASALPENRQVQSGIILPGAPNAEDKNGSGNDKQRPYGIVVMAAAMLLLFFSVRKNAAGK